MHDIVALPLASDSYVGPISNKRYVVCLIVRLSPSYCYINIATNHIVLHNNTTHQRRILGSDEKCSLAAPYRGLTYYHIYHAFITSVHAAEQFAYHVSIVLSTDQ